MAARRSLLPLVFLLALLTGCSSTSPVEPPDTEAATLPLLTAEQTIGTTLYGGADLPAEGMPARALLDDAAARGLGGFTYYVDWSELEPEPGRYTLETFTVRLDALRRLGVRPFVNITVGDIDAYNLPDGLSDGAGGLAPGVALDDPAVVERFGNLLDRVVPLVVERGGFVLGVGNEVDERFREHPDERDAYVRFAEAARDRVHAIEPRLAVGVALTNKAVRDDDPTYRALRAVMDIVPFNHAPIQSDFFVRDLDEVRSDFREVVAAYGDGPIVIQELTCPSAASMGASEAWQEGCFERLFAEMAATPQVRFASVFTFQDFDVATCEAVREVLFGDELDDLPEDIARRLADYLCELGVVRPDSTPKPAWDIVLEAAEATAE
jgi:hypothetical protein